MAPLPLLLPLPPPLPPHPVNASMATSIKMVQTAERIFLFSAVLAEIVK